LVAAYARESDKSRYLVESLPVPQPTTIHRLKTLMLKLPAQLGLWAARIGFWRDPDHRWALKVLLRYRPRLVIANDWPALVVAAAFKEKTGALIHYDSHEFATVQFDESPWWRLVYKPMVAHLEGATIGAADTISTIGPGLAQALASHYRLEVRPSVVRNIPNRIELSAKTHTPWPLRLLYHGHVLPNRGLEALIDSVSMWQHSHRLTIRGRAHAAYLGALKRRASATGRPDLIVFEDAVPPEQVMPLAAATADVGVFFSPLGTYQRRFTLPNKLFEYIGAGLATAVSPGPDLKAIVEDNKLGVISRDTSARSLAEAINGLTPANVSDFKAAARAAADVFCWEREQQALKAVLAPLLLRMRSGAD
jgi:glycosyltransferase involved in cell wall biosynthesis